MARELKIKYRIEDICKILLEDISINILNYYYIRGHSLGFEENAARVCRMVEHGENQRGIERAFFKRKCYSVVDRRLYFVGECAVCDI